MMKRVTRVLVVALLVPWVPGLPIAVQADDNRGEGSSFTKHASTFYPPQLIETARQNAQKYSWGKRWQTAIVNRARPWLKYSDDELWSLMFGPTLTRSWDVACVSNCPSCDNFVTEFAWHSNVFVHPWKVVCPFCRELFPKNDYLAYYRSGLDERNLFHARRADRSLLYNLDHPDPADPLHTFGVDDGTGYVDQRDNTYRFIATYFVYGQWKQHVLDGIRRLAAAYVVTGDSIYAHKAGILLDRVADLYPTFNWAEQEGYVYGRRDYANGYVTVWHDSCQETLTLSMAYDRIFDAIKKDTELVSFLSKKAKKVGLENSKQSFADIQDNIEGRILRDALTHTHKISCNYPYTDLTMNLMEAILEWPHNQHEIYAAIDKTMQRVTAVDGVTGEKGLTQYSAWPLTGWSVMLAEFDKIDPVFLKNLYARHPKLRDLYRFFIDLWCQDRQYYPNNGDGVNFAFRQATYLPAIFHRPGRDLGHMIGWALTERDDRILWQLPSMYTFFWHLYEVTGEPFLVQVLYGENDRQVEGLPWDLHAPNPEKIVQGVAEVIQREGPQWKIASVNKQQYHMAILRSGKEPGGPEVWLDYDNWWGGHHDADGMHLGLFAKGLDLIPDLGYQMNSFVHPDATQAQITRMNYYNSVAGHNTVAVNGRDPLRATGQTTLWANGKHFHAVRASGPEMIRYLDSYEVKMMLAEEDGVLLQNGRFEKGLEHWEVTGDTWKHSPNAYEGSHFARSGEQGTGTLSQSAVVDRRYLRWQAMGWDGQQATGKNYFQILNVDGVVLKTIPPPFADHWENQFVDLYDLGLKNGNTFTFKTVDGHPKRRFAWLACDYVRQANSPQDSRPPRKQYERSVVLVNISAADGYLIDIFRVVGGHDHAKFLRSHFGTISTDGLDLEPHSGYEHYREAFRNWRADLSPSTPWSVDWQIEDRYRHLPSAADVHLRFTDLTEGVEAYTAESWIYTNYEGHSAFGYPAVETWIPMIMQRRRHVGDGPLHSTFVSLIEPYENQSNISHIRRLPLSTSDRASYPDSYVCVEVTLADGRKDLLIAADVENPSQLQTSWQPGRAMVQLEWDVHVDGQLAWFRTDERGQLQRMALCKVGRVDVGGWQVVPPLESDYVEYEIEDGRPRIVSD